MTVPLPITSGVRPHTKLGCSTTVLSGLRPAKQTSMAQQQHHQIEGRVTFVGGDRRSVPLIICHKGASPTMALLSSSARYLFQHGFTLQPVSGGTAGQPLLENRGEDCRSCIVRLRMPKALNLRCLSNLFVHRWC